MTKADICKKVAEKCAMNKTEAEKAVTGVLDVVQGALAEGDKVQFTGFGTFSVEDRAARTGRNPQTGAAIQIPASKSVKFKPGSVLKDAVK